MTQLRIRTRDTRSSKNKVIGTTFTRDANGKETLGSPVSDIIAEGVKEISVDELHGKPPYHTGGMFFHFRLTDPGPKVVASGTLFPLQAFQGGVKSGYRGGFRMINLPALPSLGSETITAHDDYRLGVNENDLSSLGDRGYNKLRPKVDVGGLAQAVLEARDLPRMLQTSARGFHDVWKSLGGNLSGDTMTPKGVANHFINHQFGWRPFLQDVANFYDVTVNFDEHVARITKANDRWQRKEYHEAPISSSSIVHDALWIKSRDGSAYKSYFSPFVSQVASTSRMLVKRQKMTRIWYVGSFKYYYPEFDEGLQQGYPAVRRLRQALRLHGAMINPTLIYKVTPWTWAVDWFVGVGDSIQRLQDMATNAVACQYMYLMRETYDRYMFEATESTTTGTQLTGTTYLEVRIKRRAAAGSPFGFSMAPGGLSPMQMAILGALGISRV